MFINDILLKNIFFQSLLCFSGFVLACEENYSPGVRCTVDESLPEFRGRCDFKQCIPNKPSIWNVLFKVTPSFIWSHLPLFGFFEDLQRSWNSCSRIANSYPSCAGFDSFICWIEQKCYNGQLLHFDSLGFGAEGSQFDFGWHIEFIEEEQRLYPSKLSG